jgi:beta-lactamase regulating signal transducer with metallopeptidase domain
MQPFLDALEAMIPTVWQASWQAACLAVLVWTLTILLRDRIGARWRFLLWSLVFVRLALPVVPMSPASVFRLAQITRGDAAALSLQPSSDSPPLYATVEAPEPVPRLAVQPTENQMAVPRAEAVQRISPAGRERMSGQSAVAEEPAVVPAAWNWTGSAALVWFAVVIMLVARRGVQQWFLARRAINWWPCDAPHVAALMAQCCQRLKIRRRIAVLVSEDGSGPAITAALEPRVVLPASVIEACSADQLEMILLHELAHVRRHDVLVHELLLFLRAVHWFNPVAWWVFRRLQAEREMACDEIVLDVAGADRRHSYGMTLLEIIRNNSRPILSPGLLGSADPTTRLQRRLAMIRDYRTRSRRSTCLAIIAVTVVAVLGLTKPPVAQPDEPRPVADKTATDSATPGDNSPIESAKSGSLDIKGRCLDDDGRPLAGAEVCLFYFTRYGADPKQTWRRKTGPDGRFRFEELKRLTDGEQLEYYVVAARKPQRTSSARLLFAGDSSSDFELTLSGNAGALSGRVTDERGKPLAGVQVYQQLATNPLPGFWEDTTDENGRFSIPDFQRWDAADTERIDPKSGTRSRVAHCWFGLRHSDYPLTMGFYTAIPQEVNVQLQPGITIEGRVVDDVTGKPAADVVVVAQGIKERNSETVTTDRQGKYRLRLTPDLYNIGAQASDRTCTALDSFDAPVGNVTKAPDLKLVEGGFIVGKVVDKATGKPVTKLPNGRALYVAHYGPAHPKSGAAVGTTVVQDDGTYRLRVAPGPNSPYLMDDVEAERTPYNATSVDPIIVREGETVTLDFHVSPRTPNEVLRAQATATSERQRRTRPLKPAPGKAALVGQVAKPARERKNTDVGRLLNRLDELRLKIGQDDWAIALRDLIQLGPNAVPELIAEMDASDNDYMLRCMGFVLRGIGDKRAVPALIRALPKACVDHGSDCGFIAKDPQLLAFMQKYDMDDTDEFKEHYYSFGRAVNEFRVALQKLTGQTHGEDEIVYVSLEGSDHQRYLQRKMYHRVAQRWADWWEQNWEKYVDDPHYAKVNLPPPPTEPASPLGEFPHGPAVKIDGQHSGWLLESVRRTSAENVFYDLDTGRVSNLPKQLLADEGQPERLDDINAWAAREGFDLMGTEYTPPGSDKPHYVLRGLGLSAWHIETDRWQTLETDLQKEGPFEMGPRVDGLLAHFDSTHGRYEPAATAAFLFKTREGGYGAIFVGVEVHDDSLKPGGVSSGDEELRPIAFRKGRRFAYSLIVPHE